ncbi:integral membrane protein [Klebsiella pneumoniae]|uniref:Ascorbate-specific PTS system EIIC component n=1 Tax=Klebsiella pneumoniae TaxID=573 RepID=A0A447RGW6_KLEPN|nr:integral membrane protein [Klebsiella pneumoniae]
MQPFTRKITNTDDLALGHFGSIGYLLSALVGKIIGKGSPSIEEIKVPKSLNFLRDSSVAISLTMMILFLVLVLVAGKSFVEETLERWSELYYLRHYSVPHVCCRSLYHPRRGSDGDCRDRPGV